MKETLNARFRALKEFYRARQDAFFAFDDHENCRRIFEDALEYQRKR